MGLNALMDGLMDQVRRLMGTSSNYSISAATTALSGMQPGTDLSGVTAAASDVLTGKAFVNSSGTLVNGAMTNRGAVSQALNVNNLSYTVPSGYHNGNGTVSAQSVAGSASVVADNADHTYTAADNKFYHSFKVKKSRVVTYTAEVSASVGSNSTTFEISVPATAGMSADLNHISLNTKRVSTPGTTYYYAGLNIDVDVDSVGSETITGNYVNVDFTTDPGITQRTTSDSFDPLEITLSKTTTSSHRKYTLTVNETLFPPTMVYVGRVSYFEKA